MTHDLVDLAVLLAADKLFVLVRQLNLHTHLVLATLDEGNLVDDHHGSLNGVVGSIDGKVQIVEAYFSTRVRADIREHRSNFCMGWTSHSPRSWINRKNPPRSTVKLTSLMRC